MVGVAGGVTQDVMGRLDHKGARAPERNFSLPPQRVSPWALQPFPELAICNSSYCGALRSCQNGMGKRSLQIPQHLIPKAPGPGAEQGESGGRTGFISLKLQPR